MEKKNHKVLDNPYLGYLVLAIFAVVLVSIGSAVGQIFDAVIFDSAYTIFFDVLGAAGAVLAAFIFKLWFKPDFDGCFKFNDLAMGFKFLLPMLLVHYIGSIISISHDGLGNILVAFCTALLPGFGEEVIFRGLCIANLMRTVKSRKSMVIIFWLTSIVFGLAHMANAANGAPLWISVIQSIYAIGIGMALCGVYLRTGNLLICAIAHASLDFLEICRLQMNSTGGLMSTFGLGDWITVAAAVIGAVIGIMLVREQHWDDIQNVWKKKWNQE